MEVQKIKSKTEFKIRKSNLKTEFKSQISSQVTCFKQLKFLILKLWLSGWASNINDLSFKAQWVENNSKRAFLSNTTNKKSFFYETMSWYFDVVIEEQPIFERNEESRNSLLLEKWTDSTNPGSLELATLPLLNP